MIYVYIYIHESKITLLGDEQTRNGSPSFLLNDEQIRNCSGVVRTSQDFLDPLLSAKNSQSLRWNLTISPWNRRFRLWKPSFLGSSRYPPGELMYSTRGKGRRSS